MDSTITYLKNDELLEEKMEASILQLKAARYMLYDDKLYRRGYSMPLLKCVLPHGGEEHHVGNPRGHIWKPHLGAILGIHSPKVGLLLADHRGKLHGVCPKM